MGDGCTDHHPSADEMGELRRRVADLERANARLSEQLLAGGCQRYEDLIENMNDIIYTTDREGSLLSVNQAVKRILGFDPQEVIGTHYGRWMPKEEFDKLEAARPGTLGGQRAINQVVMNDREGRDRYVEISVGPLVVDGRIEGTQGIIRDITARHLAERQVRESEEQLRALFNAVTESILLVDIHGTILTMNGMAAKRFGYAIDEMIGRRPTDIAPSLMRPKVAERREAAIREVFETGKAAHGEDERMGLCFDVSMYPVFGADGEVASVAVFAKDITERKQLEQKLRESEECYRAVVESAGETIAIVDAQGVFRFMNTTAARRLGGHPAEFMGKTMWDLFPGDIADRQAAYVRDVMESGQGKSTVSLSSIRGELRWYCTTVEPLRDGTGNVTAGLIVARDIHDFQTARQELDTYREKMIRAEHLASLGTLSAMLAHEMTQPLTVIRLSIQNAIKTLESASPGLTVLEDLNDGLAGTSDMTAIVERFRDFAGKMSDGTTGEISLLAVARRVIRLLEESARKARITLGVNLSDDLPLIHTCGKEIEQVFFILAQNAIQAADGSRDHCFHIRGARRAGAVELQFADDCGGIAPKILERIFEPFVTTKPPGEGTGLGLCVVQRIVSQVGGHVKVDSRWGEGTTFFLTLPIETK